MPKEYIDRETIIRKLNEIGGCDASDEWSKGWDKAIDTAVKAVEKLPAVDVAPVKHGKWIKATKPYPYYDYRCSACGCEEYRHIDSKGKVRIMNFCPNCGADMSNT